MGEDLALGDGPPVLEAGGEAGDEFGVGFGEVLVFVGVVEEVEELGADFGEGTGFGVAVAFAVVGEEELPGAFDDPAEDEGFLGFFDVGDIVGEGFAEDFFAGGGFAGFEDGEEVQAGEVGGDFGVGGGEGGGDDVDAGAELFFAVAGLDGAFPGEHEGLAGAAFVGGLFGARGVGGAVGVLDPAVVGDVDEEGVFGEAFGFDFVHELAAGLVEPFDHGVVACDVVGLDAFGFVFLEEVVGRGMRAVGHHGGVPDEEGFFLGGGVVDEGEDGIEAFAANFEAVVAVAAAGVGEATSHGFGEAGALGGAFPPFAGLVAEVAFVAEEFDDGGLLVVVADEFFAEGGVFGGVGFGAFGLGFALAFGFGGVGGSGGSEGGGVVAGDFALVGVEAGGEGGEGGAAEGGGDVAAGEEGAAGGEFVEVGGFDLFVAHETVVGPGVVVGDEEDDVGLVGGGGGEGEGDGERAED